VKFDIAPKPESSGDKRSMRNHHRTAATIGTGVDGGLDGGGAGGDAVPDGAEFPDVGPAGSVSIPKDRSNDRDWPGWRGFNARVLNRLHTSISSDDVARLFGRDE
jgi:hypothetical protein